MARYKITVEADDSDEFMRKLSAELRKLGLKIKYMNSTPKPPKITFEEAVSILKELNTRYGDEMPTSLLSTDVYEAFVLYDLVEPVQQDKKPS